MEKLGYEASYDFLEELLQDQEVLPHLDTEKHLIWGESAYHQKALEFELPLLFPRLYVEEELSDYLERIPPLPPDYLILLIQAGTAALGYFEAGIVDSHKVIRKYMVRAKQGKAQIKHLKTKGKSRLGSRIRLQQTHQFFEEINEKLLEWEVEHVDWILHSASIQLWNLMFDSKVTPPFDKRDERLLKIPLDLPTPNYEELLKVNEFALEGRLRRFDVDS